MYLNFSIYTVFSKNRNIISKIRRSKVTDYAALNVGGREVNRGPQKELEVVIKPGGGWVKGIKAENNDER